jgi:hypothetical protein
MSTSFSCPSVGRAAQNIYHVDVEGPLNDRNSRARSILVRNYTRSIKIGMQAQNMFELIQDELMCKLAITVLSSCV